MPALPSVSTSLIEFVGDLFTNDEPEVTVWDRVQIISKPTSSIDPADRFVSTLDVVNITNGEVDSSWTDTDFANVEAAISGFMGWYMTQAANGIAFVETRHYLMSFNPLPPAGTPPVGDGDPANDDDPFALSGPPARIFTRNVTAPIGNVPMAHQVAITSTEKTPYPRHWGRNYWPCPAAGLMTAAGRWSNPTCTELATRVATMYGALADLELFPVVPITRILNPEGGSGSVPFRGLLGVTEIQVDDLPDIIRRRRPKSTLFRAIAPV